MRSTYPAPHCWLTPRGLPAIHLVIGGSWMRRMSRSTAWRYVYRAIDQDGQVIDVLVSAHRDADAARRFFGRALATLKVTPSEVVTDAAAIYPAVIEEFDPVGVAPRRTVRQQSDRGRSQPAQTPAQTDARAANGSDRAGDHCRTRLHAESPSRPLRTRTRRPTSASSRGCLHRTRAGDLTRS